MTLVSHAQNFEDVLLWRALHDVEAGTYLDIGAQDPVVDSVSHAFYQAGWRGIHVEATPFYAARLREARPDENVIEAAVTDADGPMPFFEIPRTGISTGKSDIAAHHVQLGFEAREILVPTVRLEQLLELADRDFHWMKVDVEGMEADVLRSWRRNGRRPWLLVIESTFPNTQEPTHQLWIEEVLGRGYREVFFDGLSRYFVHESRSELAARFESPANFFDGFAVARHHFSAAFLRGQLEAVERQSEDQTAEIARLHAEAASTTERLLREQQERETALRQAHDKQLGDALRRQRSAAERELRQKEASLRDEVKQAEAAAASKEAELVRTGIELARLEERSAQLEQRLVSTQDRLRRSDDELAESREAIGSLQARLDHARAQAQREIEGYRAAVARADALIRAALAQRQGRWQRFGEALGLARPSPALRLLERWSPIGAGPDFDPGVHAISDEMKPTMQTDASTEAQELPQGASSLAGLLSADDSDFVRLAYLTLLGREADQQGAAYYAGRLVQGHSKIEVLDQLRRSAEGRRRPAMPEIDGALRRFRLSSLVRGKRAAGAAIEQRVLQESSLVSVNHFMRYHDEEFLAQVFAFYLGRPADEEAVAHYTRLLRSGVSRQQVLLDVARSPEARKRGKTARGEGRVAAALFVDRIPVVRTLAAIVRFNLNLRAHMRDMRALQNHLYRLSKKVP